MFKFDRIVDSLIELPRLLRWIVSFCLAFTLVACGTILLVSPALFFGAPIDVIVQGSAAGGIGAGLVHATLISLMD